MTMTGQQIARLVRMANQIARNMGAAGDEKAVAAGVGEHLGKFWTPAMLQQLLSYHRDGGTDLLPAVQCALDALPGRAAGDS